MDFLRALLYGGRDMIIALDRIYPISDLNVSAWDMALCATIISIVIDVFFFVEDGHADDSYNDLYPF